MNRGNNKGFTLVEVLVAIAFLCISMLAILHAMGLSVEHNMKNILMDEAVRIAEQRMNELRNTPIPTLISSSPSTQIIVTRRLRNISVNYTVNWVIEEFSTSSRSIQVLVQWNWKNIDHRHTATSVVTMGT